MKSEVNKEVWEQLNFIDAGCEFKLANFEGPIELLWYMIKQSQIDIDDVKLADITEQYLDYMSSLDSVDLERASDFIEIASILIEIKSHSLLPYEVEEEEEEEDPEVLLLRQIKEYDIFRSATEKLKVIEEVKRLYKPIDEKVNDYRYVLGTLTLGGLLDAFSKMFIRTKKEEQSLVPKKIEKDKFTVAQKIIAIRKALTLKGHIRLSELFSNSYSKSEMINLFLAILELLKMQEIIVKQIKAFDDIDIEKKEYKEGNRKTNVK